VGGILARLDRLVSRKLDLFRFGTPLCRECDERGMRARNKAFLAMPDAEPDEPRRWNDGITGDHHRSGRGARRERQSADRCEFHIEVAAAAVVHVGRACG